jgi:hypothetical protein
MHLALGTQSLGAKGPSQAWPGCKSQTGAVHTLLAQTSETSQLGVSTAPHAAPTLPGLRHVPSSQVSPSTQPGVMPHDSPSAAGGKHLKPIGHMLVQICPAGQEPGPLSPHGPGAGTIVAAAVAQTPHQDVPPSTAL